MIVLLKIKHLMISCHNDYIAFRNKMPSNFVNSRENILFIRFIIVYSLKFSCETRNCIKCVTVFYCCLWI